MRKVRIEFRLSLQERKAINKASCKFGLNLSDYIRRKLFDENEDLANANEKYVSPHNDKHNLITISVLYKTYYLLKELLEKQNNSVDVIDLEKNSLEYARRERERYGYNVIKNEDEL
jgi:hypothetical protein